MKCVYPGTFDPMTNGHFDIVKRAASIFDEVIVSILYNPEKKTLFSVEERMTMIKDTCKNIPNVRVDSFDGLLVDYLNLIDVNVVLRGLRSASDFESEFRMGQINRALDSKIETLFISTSPSLSHLSSSMVREIAYFNGDVSQFVPNCVLKYFEIHNMEKL